MSLFNRNKILSEQHLLKTSHYFKEGQEFLRNKAFKKALESFINASKEIPNQPKILNNIGVTLSQLNDYERAVSYYEKALEQDQEYLIAYYNMAIALYNLERYESALISVNFAYQLVNQINDKTSYERTLLVKENILLKLGRIDEAIEILEEYLESEYSLSLQLKLADLYNQTKQYSKIIRLFVHPGHPISEGTSLNALLLLMEAFVQLDDLDGIEQVTRLLSIKIDQPEQLIQLYQQLLSQNKLLPALTIGQRFIKLKPDHCEMGFNVAELFIRLNRKSEAIQTLYQLFQELMKSDRINEMEKATQQIWRWQPDFLQPHFDFIDYFRGQSNLKRVAQEYEILLEKHLTQVKIYKDYIHVLEELSQEDRSFLNRILETWEKLVTIYPEDPEILFSLGKAYASFMKYPEAIQFMELALQFKPDLWDAYYELGLLYLAIQKPNRALTYLLKIRERRKEFGQIEEIIKEIRGLLRKK